MYVLWHGMYTKLCPFFLLHLYIGTTVSFSVPSKAKSSLNITCPREAVSTNNCTLTKINNFACKENFNGTIDVTYLVCSGKG